MPGATRTAAPSPILRPDRRGRPPAEYLRPTGRFSYVDYRSRRARALMDVALRIGIIVLLVLANAIFVAAEYALVTARRSRLAERAERGGRG
ncbi:MAG: CNNM domain-containing protein, partial [Gaiellaceae bacterium]